jgi:hypothetical protein
MSRRVSLACCVSSSLRRAREQAKLREKGCGFIEVYFLIPLVHVGQSSSVSKLFGIRVLYVGYAKQRNTRSLGRVEHRRALRELVGTDEGR